MLERVWREGNLPTLLVGMEIGTATVENRMEGPQKTKTTATIWSGKPTPGHISREKHGPKCTSVFTTALFTVTRTWQQPKCWLAT